MTVETYFAVSRILFLAGAVPAFLFVLVYHVSAPWWRSAAGRHLMAFTALVGVTLGWGAAGLILPPYPGRFIIGLVLYSLVAAALWWRLFLLIRTQHRDRDDPPG